MVLTKVMTSHRLFRVIQVCYQYNAYDQPIKKTYINGIFMNRESDNMSFIPYLIDRVN
jgi:hypothetical protein